MNHAEQFLWYITAQGATQRYGNNIPPQVIKRIQLEMDVIIPNKFTDYILMIWDIHDFGKSPNRVMAFCAMMGLEPPPDGIIPIGPGRGSVGGSMVCHCIGIHQCDPILFGLYFERFLNPERIAYPDIDFDISRRYRHIILAYIAWKYGEKHVAQIITYSTLSAKTVVHDVLQSAQVSSNIIDTVKATIPDDPEITIPDLEQNPKFIQALKDIPFPDTRMQVDANNIHKMLATNRWISGDPDTDGVNKIILDNISSGKELSGYITIRPSWNWEKALNIMKRLEGLNKHESTHAAGVVVAPVELETNVPLLRKDGDGVLACQYDMVSLEALGFLKMDALGLRTVDVNHEASRLVRQWYDPDFDQYKIPYDDEKSMQLIRDGDTIGIFQIESTGFTQMMQDINIGGYEVPRCTMNQEQLEFVEQVEALRGLNINDFMWISAGLALYRPGPLDAIVEGKTMVQHLIDRKAGREAIIYLFPGEKAYLEETYGVLVYQEQVMARVRQMTGCTLGRADILRKAMGKKDPVLMKEQMDWFIENAMKHDFSPEVVDPDHRRAIVERAAYEIEAFARYGFNKAHTVEYGHICYQNAYLKSHYPVAFYTAILNSYSDTPDRQSVIIRDMLKHNVALLPPLVNESGPEFTMTDPNTIRFGLGAIKNIGNNALDHIFKEREIRGPFKNVEDFRIRIPATACNVVGMTSLAKCGAFDMLLDSGLKPMGSRATLVASMKDVCESIKKITQKKGKNPKPTIEESLAKLHTISYYVTPTDEDVIEYAVWEKEMLKYYISAHPIDAYIDEIDRWTAIQDVELEDLPSEFYIAGFVESCHETVIKKEGRNKGKTMGFLSIGTQYRTYEATLFPGVYESCLPYIEKGKPVVLKGKRNSYKDKVTIQGVYVRGMSNSGIRDCPECHIRLHNPTPLDLLPLKQMFNEHPGMTVVHIHVVDGRDDIAIQCSQPIALNDRIIDYCNQIGKIAYKPI